MRGGQTSTSTKAPLVTKPVPKRPTPSIEDKVKERYGKAKEKGTTKSSSLGRNYEDEVNEDKDVYNKDKDVYDEDEAGSESSDDSRLRRKAPRKDATKSRWDKRKREEEEDWQAFREQRRKNRKESPLKNEKGRSKHTGSTGTSSSSSKQAQTSLPPIPYSISLIANAAYQPGIKAI